MSQAQPAPLSAAEIERLIAVIEACIDKLQQGESPVNMAIEVEQLFTHLRDEARAGSTAVKPHIEQLKSLRTTFDDLAMKMTGSLVDHLSHVKDSIKGLEAEYEYVRAILVKLCDTRHVKTFDGQTAHAFMHTSVRRSLPPSGSDQRHQLESVVRTEGLWDKVSQLSGPKLTTLLNSKQVNEATRAKLDPFCPPTTTHALRLTPNDQSRGS